MHTNKQINLLSLAFKTNVMRGSRGGGGGGGDRGSGPPPLEFENFTLKKVISGFFFGGGGLDPLVCDQKLPFLLDPLS